jgi:hypothetical protein
MALKIFVSYAREDRAVARSLCDDLSIVHYDTFMDDELSGGHAWWDTLLERIRSCDVFLPILSTHWLDSVPCSLEAQYAIELDRNLLPVAIEEVSPRLMPAPIAETQWVNYERVDKASALRLVAAIENLDPIRPLPDPLPVPPPVPISYLTRLQERVTVDSELARTEQELLLVELRRLAEVGDERDDVLFLATRFRSRHDLNVRVASDLDDLIAVLRGAREADETIEPPRPPGPPAPPRPADVARWAPPLPDPSWPPPAPRLPARSGNAKIVAAYVLATIAVLVFPIVFGPIAILLANSARRAGNPHARTALIYAVAATVVGFVLGALVNAVGGG